MNSEETPQSYPSVQSIEQVMDVTSDAWEAFFVACRELAEKARQRRAARQQAEINHTLPSHNESI